jgi:hypothetical protein
MAYLFQVEASINPGTPEGMYNFKLALSGDEEAARIARNELALQQLEARVGSQPIPEVIQ